MFLNNFLKNISFELTYKVENKKHLGNKSAVGI